MVESRKKNYEKIPHDAVIKIVSSPMSLNVARALLETFSIFPSFNFSVFKGVLRRSLTPLHARICGVFYEHCNVIYRSMLQMIHTSEIQAEKKRKRHGREII